MADDLDLCAGWLAASRVCRESNLRLLNSIGMLFQEIAALIGAGRTCASKATCLTGWQSVCYAPVCASGASTLVGPQTPR